MILAYPARASVDAGSELVLHVSTDRRRFRVHLLNWTGALEPMLTTGWLRGQHLPPRGADDDWDWPAYRVPIPAGWPPAVCVAWCETDGGASPAIAMSEAAALFVIRGTGRDNGGRIGKNNGALLYKLPLATYHAYNDSGEGCYYNNPRPSAAPPGARVSLRRPGGGIGGPVWGAPDHYDPSSPRQCFAHWDAPFIAWLLRQGFALDYCTDFDLAEDHGLCARYKLLVSAGHDEYWSDAARDQVEDFVSGGGNVAFFGANTCWWRIHLVDDMGAMVCHQGGPRGALDSWSGHGGAGRPEDGLGGLSYRHGGGWWDGPRVTSGYAVERPAHWVFAGTGLGAHERFGADAIPPMPGYECDGAPLAQLHPARLAPYATDTGTPRGLELLAVGELSGAWQELPSREFRAAREGIHAACMSIFTRNGTVFNAGSTDWTQALVGGRDPRLAAITRNVVHGLLEGKTA
jgi:hypothetical protein